METVEARPDSPAKSPPPYFAFRTLLNTLEDMKKRGIPTRIDRTYLTGMSGAGQTQFIAGMKSLGLIDPAGNVQPQLEAMVAGSSADRQRVLGEVLRARYPEAVSLGAQNATTGQLMDVFKGYGVQGDTARKAIAFYLGAAKYAGGIPLSPLFQTPKVSASSGTTRRKRRAATSAGDETNGGDEGSSSTPAAIPIPDFHPTLAGVLSEFPKRGRGWTQARRDKVMAMLEMAVDFTIPIVDEDEEEEFEEAETDATLDE